MIDDLLKIEKYITTRRLVFIFFSLLCLFVSFFLQDWDFKRRVYTLSFILFLCIFNKEEESRSDSEESSLEESRDEVVEEIDLYA